MTCQEFLDVIQTNPDDATPSTVLAVLQHTLDCSTCKELFRNLYSRIPTKEKKRLSNTNRPWIRRVAVALLTDPELQG